VRALGIRLVKVSLADHTPTRKKVATKRLPVRANESRSITMFAPFILYFHNSNEKVKKAETNQPTYKTSKAVHQNPTHSWFFRTFCTVKFAIKAIK
jgi:hypothetical protein